MNKNPMIKPLTLAIGAALATSVAGVALAKSEAGNPFGASLLTAGYMVHSFGDPAQGGAAKADTKATAEGKCGEGKCGEGKCGGADKGEHMHAQGEKIAEGKCGEGKCGEGKCGGADKGAHVHAKAAGKTGN